MWRVSVPVPAEGLDVNDFYAQTGEKVEELSARLTEILLSIEDPDIRVLMECYLADDPLMRNVCRAPAGVKTHHAHYGGLIEHIVNIAESALKIHDLYPAVDLSLLLAGVFLHDLGKVREMAYENSFVYTDEGQLLGHLVIGVEMLNEKLADFDQRTGKPFPEEAALRIKHMIVSHHGSYEFGSPKLPMTARSDRAASSGTISMPR